MFLLASKTGGLGDQSRFNSLGGRGRRGLGFSSCAVHKIKIIKYALDARCREDKNNLLSTDRFEAHQKPDKSVKSKREMDRPQERLWPTIDGRC